MKKQVILNRLKMLLRGASRVATGLYENSVADNNYMLGLIARTVSRGARRKKGELHWAEIWPQVRQWVGGRQFQDAFQHKIDWSVEPHELTFKIDRQDLDLDGEDALIQRAAETGQAAAQAWGQAAFEFAFKPIKDNAVCYDGQNLLDDDHPWPDGTTRSNLFTTTRAGSTTIAQAHEDVKTAIRKLMENRLPFESALLYRANGTGTVPLTVCVRNTADWSAFYDLQRKDILLVGGAEVRNPFLGAFELIHLQDDEANRDVDFIRSTPGGPRPTLWVPASTPGAFEFDEGEVFRNRQISYGNDANMGFGPAFWQPIVRSQIV